MLGSLDIEMSVAQTAPKELLSLSTLRPLLVDISPSRRMRRVFQHQCVSSTVTLTLTLKRSKFNTKLVFTRFGVPYVPLFRIGIKDSSLYNALFVIYIIPYSVLNIFITL
jgi:hypothetical protein